MDAFGALSEPNRRILLESIREQPCTVGMLVKVAGLSQPAVSKHLKVLKQANLVSVRPDGQKRWYELNAQPLEEIDAFLGPYRRFLGEKLDDLARHLDQIAEEEDNNE